jgi:hypothetical protein
MTAAIPGTIQAISTYTNSSALTTVNIGGSVIVVAPPGTIQGSFTTSAQSNSTSITLSYAFTALTFTQTSTGNTINLPTGVLQGQVCGFSIDSNVTNLTVSSATNTVKNGAATSTTSAGASLWWIYNVSNTTWYRYDGVYLSQ